MFTTDVYIGNGPASDARLSDHISSTEGAGPIGSAAPQSLPRSRPKLPRSVSLTSFHGAHARREEAPRLSTSNKLAEKSNRLSSFLPETLARPNPVEGRKSKGGQQ